MRSILRATFATVFVVAVTLDAQAPNVEQELNRAQDVLLDSVQRGDAAAYARVTADNWVNIGADGELLTMAQRQEQFRRGAFPGPGQTAPGAPPVYYKRLDYSVRVLGNTAVTTWRNPPSAAEPGGAIQARVWVKHDGRWQQLHIQTTRLPAR